MFRPQDPSCGGYRHGVWTAPSPCPHPVAAAGLYFNRADHRPYRWSVWWAFACPEHAHELIAARPLLDRDHAELARRRDLREHWTPGRGVEPLAIGRPATELVERAQRWATAHPEQTYTAPAARRPDPARPDSRGHPFDAYASTPGAQSGNGGGASGGSSPEPPA
jgi:hypothetical protein